MAFMNELAGPFWWFFALALLVAAVRYSAGKRMERVESLASTQHVSNSGIIASVMNFIAPPQPFAHLMTREVVWVTPKRKRERRGIIMGVRGRHREPRMRIQMTNGVTVCRKLSTLQVV